MTYKPEIDGLRAVAVLLVLLCHMQLGFMGGFIGVDVFFVISGFLITTIVVNGIAQDHFSFWSFYARRFVRLYPALIVVVLLTFIAGFLLVSPTFLEAITRSGKYALASASNVFFNRHLGYFDVAAQGQVFLHTWSLGVEWQFYLAWPLLVWMALKLSRYVLWAMLLAITIASLVASQTMLDTNANAAYYLMPYRAFELGIGALLALVYEKPASRPTSILLVLAGIAAILYSALVYTSSTPFPGVAALLPCLGTAACIYGGKGFNVGNVLRWSPVVYIGKISYSVYLVHWPLLVLYSYYVFRNISTLEKIALFTASLVLGALLYALVETRINWKRLGNKLVDCSAMVALVVVMVGAFQYVSNQGEGLPWRLGNNELNDPQYTMWGGENYEHELFLGAVDTPPSAIVAGDSLAGSLASGMDYATRQTPGSLDLIFSPGCLISEIDYRPQATPQCRALTQATFDNVSEDNLPLVLVQAWWFVNNTPVTKEDAQKGVAAGTHDFLLANLDDIRKRLNGQAMVLVGGVPLKRMNGGEQECLLRPNYLPQACEAELSDYRVEDIFIHKTNLTLKAYAQAHARENVYFIDIEPILCPNGICSARQNAKLYADGIHLSYYGAKLVAPHVLEQIKGIVQQLQQTPSQGALSPQS